MAQLPIRPFTAARAASAWKMPVAEAQAVLDTLASRAILLDLRQGEEQMYVLPPPMAGFLRVLADARAGRRRSAAALRAFLPVHHRRGGLHQGPLHDGDDAARPGVRARAGPHERAGAARARLRARERRHRRRGGHGRRDVLLPAQEAAPRTCVRCADGHLHDVRRHGAVPHRERIRAAGGCGGGDRPAPAGPRPAPRAVRRERPPERRLHLQLLRLLLRGDDRRAALRQPASRPYDELPPGRGRRVVQRLRAVRERVRGGRDGARLRAGSEAREEEAGAPRRRHLSRLRRVRRGVRQGLAGADASVPNASSRPSTRRTASC